MISGFVEEVFSGVQGEGLYVGERQLFIRLYGCNLRCGYCDTARAQTSTGECSVETNAGQRDFAHAENPVSSGELLAHIDRLTIEPGLHRRISLTGGEPLVQPEYVQELCTGLRSRSQSVLIETNGTMWSALEKVIPLIDVVSMDIKLPSVSGSSDCLEDHLRFLRVAVRKSVYVKIVVSANTCEGELERAAAGIAAVGISIPVVLQPVTGDCDSPSACQMLQWQAQCSTLLREVRVIPQCHKLIGQL